jgi:uncharacterized protein
MRVWVDIDNPPQTRYLLPLARAFEQRGSELLLTARDHGETFAILAGDHVRFHPVGRHFGRSKARKVVGLLRRSEQLVRLIRSGDSPDLLLTAARAGVLAARRLGIPSFVVLDYEHVDLRAYKFGRSCIIHPDVIDPETFRSRGLAAERLMPFRGLKEDFSFAGVDTSSIPPAEFGSGDGAAVRVLFRPPAEDSHYYRSETGQISFELLRYLGDADVQVIFSPRNASQVGYLEQVPSWHHEPIILRKPAHFASLLKAVDVVVSAGGTMLREAAFLGIPAYSIFRSRLGAVDRFLTEIGRLRIVSAQDDFARIPLIRRPPLDPLRQGRAVLDDVADMIADAVA